MSQGKEEEAIQSTIQYWYVLLYSKIHASRHRILLVEITGPYYSIVPMVEKL